MGNVGFESIEKMVSWVGWVTEFRFAKLQEGKTPHIKALGSFRGILNCGWSREGWTSLFFLRWRALWGQILCILSLSYFIWHLNLRLSYSFIYMPISYSSIIYRPWWQGPYFFESFISCIVNKSYIGWIHV